MNYREKEAVYAGKGGKARAGQKAADMAVCALFTTLIIIGAFLKIPVPVCPFTLQFLFTNLAGLILGSRLGSLSVGIYLLLGLAGFPVFTGGGGPGYLLQPTFGYLIGFLLGAFAAGKIVELHKNYRMSTLLLAGFVNLIIVYLPGMIYYYAVCSLYLKSPIGIGALFLHCFLMTVPGDIVSCIVGAGLTKRLIPVLRRRTFLMRPDSN